MLLCLFGPTFSDNVFPFTPLHANHLSRPLKAFSRSLDFSDMIGAVQHTRILFLGLDLLRDTGTAVEVSLTQTKIEVFAYKLR
jgi:hypothetical protein